MTNLRTKPLVLKTIESLRRSVEPEHIVHTDPAFVQKLEQLLENACDTLLTHELAHAQSEIAQTMDLYDLSCSLGMSSSADELIDVIMTYLQPLGATACGILQFNEQDIDNLEVTACWPSKNPFFTRLKTDNAEKTAFLPILLSHSLFVVDNTSTDPSLDEATRMAMHKFEIGAMLSAPLLLHSELIGRLVLTWPIARPADTHQTRMLHTLATQATTVAERIFLVDRYQHEIQERKQLEGVLVEAREALLRELGTPIIPVANDILLMPLIGTIDETRARRITEVLLSGIVTRGATTVIVDLSGVPSVTAQIADALVNITRAVRLVGAEIVITGMRPDMAKTLVEGGVTLEGFLVRSTVQSGIAIALGRSSARRSSSSRRTPEV